MHIKNIQLLHGGPAIQNIENTWSHDQLPCVHFPEMKPVPRREKMVFEQSLQYPGANRGCCCVYRRTRLLSKRRIVALCQHDSAHWRSVFIWFLPWLQLERFDVLGILSTLTMPFPTEWRMPCFAMDAALHENPGMKHAKATTAKQGSAWRFEVLFTRGLTTGWGEKNKEIALNLPHCFQTPC